MPVNHTEYAPFGSDVTNHEILEQDIDPRPQVLSTPYYVRTFIIINSLRCLPGCTALDCSSARLLCFASLRLACYLFNQRSYYTKKIPISIQSNLNQTTTDHDQNHTPNPSLSGWLDIAN
jgi:hypothetical protein